MVKTGFEMCIVVLTFILLFVNDSVCPKKETLDDVEYKKNGRETKEDNANKWPNNKDRRTVTGINNEDICKSKDTCLPNKHSSHISSIASYKNSITNQEDDEIRILLDNADRLIDNKKLDEALDAYDTILREFTQSPRSQYGRARALDLISELQRSNAKLDDAIKEYQLLIDLPNIPENLFVIAAHRLVSRAKFRGKKQLALEVQGKLLLRFSDDVNILNEFGVILMLMENYALAKKVFQDVLVKDPNHGSACVHYGYILKTHDNKIQEGADYMQRGIVSGEPAAQDKRFFLHLGDALRRLNRSDEAIALYEEGVQKGFFLSIHQRPFFIVQGLTPRPWWTLEQTTHEVYLKAIENDWETIRDEGLALMDQKNVNFKLREEKLTNKGDWRQFKLFVAGKKMEENCKKAPKTCAIVEKFPDAVSCTRGQIKFSLIEGGTRVWPHCGPSNCRLRAHLGLVVPPEPRIRVVNETRSWKLGEFIVLDDSFEHDLWFDGEGYRLILIIDFWHPDLTKQQCADILATEEGYLYTNYLTV